MVAQVAHDHHLLRERIEKLAGEAGVQRLEAALTAAREQAIAESDSDWETDRSAAPAPVLKVSAQRHFSAAACLAPAAAASLLNAHGPQVQPLMGSRTTTQACHIFMINHIINCD